MFRQLTFGELLAMQNELDCIINPNWKLERKPEDYDVAIIDELSELLGSGRKWKWWKAAGNPNIWNEKIEIVDIVHFYLSKIIISNQKHTKRRLNSFVGVDSQPLIAPPIFTEEGNFDHKIFMMVTNKLLSGPGKYDRLKFFLAAVGMSNAELSAIYTAKHALNAVRQTQGYKQGSYKKTRGGIEDNQRLCYIVEAFMNDPHLSLADVRRSVEDEFCGQETKKSLPDLHRHCV